MICCRIHAQEGVLGEHAVYRLTYISVPAVSISLSTAEKIKLPNGSIYRIIATARTYGLFSAFYRVDNRYIIDVDSATGLPHRMQKEIHQKTLDQQMTIDYVHASGKAVYDGGKFVPPHHSAIHHQAHNLFSMIYWLRKQSLRTGDVYEIQLDVETEPWKVRIYVEKEESLVAAGKKWLTAKTVFQFVPLKTETKRKKTDILTRRLVTSASQLIFWIAKEPPHPFIRVVFEMSPVNVVTELESLEYQVPDR